MAIGKQNRKEWAVFCGLTISEHHADKYEFHQDGAPAYNSSWKLLVLRKMSVQLLH